MWMMLSVVWMCIMALKKNSKPLSIHRERIKTTEKFKQRHKTPPPPPPPLTSVGTSCCGNWHLQPSQWLKTTKITSRPCVIPSRARKAHPAPCTQHLSHHDTAGIYLMMPSSPHEASEFTTVREESVATTRWLQRGHKSLFLTFHWPKRVTWLHLLFSESSSLILHVPSKKKY